MDNASEQKTGSHWLESSGFAHLFRIPRLAIRADNLGIGLVAVIATFVFGTVLDWVWMLRGGVSQKAVDQFILARQLDQPYSEPAGEFGIFDVWREHSRRCVLGFLASSIPGKSLAAGTKFGRYLDSHAQTRPLAYLTDLGYGQWWLLRQHPLYALLLAVGWVLIWGWAGGAICRVAAIQFARNEMLTLQQAQRYARHHLFGGSVLALFVPLGLMFFVAMLMGVGGLFLRLPLVGDLLGGAAFVLAIVGGAVVAALLIGLVIAGHLFCPAVAVESTDGFDAFSRGFSYVVSKPWRTVVYGVVSLLVTAICWIVVNLFVFAALSVTRAVVGFGTGPFGWGMRQVGQESIRKLDLLWPLAGPDALYRAPNWSQLGYFEYVSAVLIGFWVLLVVAALWAFLASLYFCCCTVTYFLLRRDVDGTDLEDVQMEEGAAEQTTTPLATAGPAHSAQPAASTAPTYSAEPPSST